MGMTPIRITDGIEVHVKDNVHVPDGWVLWMSLYVDGEYLDGGTGSVVPDLEHRTLAQAAQDWYVERTSRDPEDEDA